MMKSGVMSQKTQVTGGGYNSGYTSGGTGYASDILTGKNSFEPIIDDEDGADDWIYKCPDSRRESMYSQDPG